jgi:hypothetical protein
VGDFEMDLTVAGYEDVDGIESSAAFSAGVSETRGLREAGNILPSAAELLLLEISGFCGL